MDDLIKQFPTAESAPTGPHHDRNQLIVQRLGVVVLLAVVVAAALGLLGPTSRTTSATTPAGEVTMQYDGLTRPGADSEVALTIRPERPTDTIVVAVDQAASETYGIESFAPEPVEQRADGDRVLLEFAAAESSTIDLRLSGRTSTTQPPGRTPWRLQWLVDGSPSATLDVTTWVMP